MGLFLFLLAAGSVADYALPIVSNDPNSSFVIGSALLLETDTALTAAHVVETLGTAVTVRCGADRISGVVSKISSKFDLALVRLEQPCMRVFRSRLAPEEPVEGAHISVVGYPGGMGRLVTAGVVSLLDFYELGGVTRWAMLMDMRIFGGNSGGPVLSDKGLVVGVVTGRVCVGTSMQSRMPPECYGVATPVSSIHLFLNRPSLDAP